MSVHKEHGLLVYVDTSPDEQITLRGHSKFCMAAVVVDEDYGIPKLKQYKLGTWKKKLERAKLILDYIDKKKVNIYAVGFISDESTLMPFVKEGISVTNHELDGKWIGEKDNPKYYWNNFEYPYPLVFGVCAYVVCLSMIGIKVADWLRNMDCQKATFILDNFPQDPVKGVELAEVISKLSNTRINWIENQKRAKGASFSFYLMDSYEDEKGIKRKGKEHPNFIITDWLVASIRANAIPESFVDGEGKVRPAEDIKIVASIWRKLKENNRAFDHDLNNPEYSKKLADIQNNKSKS